MNIKFQSVHGLNTYYYLILTYIYKFIKIYSKPFQFVLITCLEIIKIKL